MVKIQRVFSLKYRRKLAKNAVINRIFLLNFVLVMMF